jgi:hypothetical protein
VRPEQELPLGHHIPNSLIVIGDTLTEFFEGKILGIVSQSNLLS